MENNTDKNCGTSNVLNVNMQESVRFPVGYRYYIVEGGKKIYGKIISDNGKSYKVCWDDGEITYEINIDAAK